MEKYLTTDNDGKPIAIGKGGMYNKKIVSIVYKKNTISTTNVIHVKDKTEHIKGKRTQSIADIKTDFEYIPNQELRETLYIAGVSGAGKSYFASRYIDKYLKLFPKNEAYLFSTKKEDDVLDKLGVNRINLDKFLEVEDVPYEMFANSICIFDDVDSLTGDLAKAVFKLRDTILMNARSQNTYCVCTIHEMFGYRTTRTCLSESQAVVFFPHTGADYAVKKYLQTRAGLDKSQIARIFAMNTRWILIYTHNPRFVLTEHEVLIL